MKKILKVFAYTFLIFIIVLLSLSIIFWIKVSNVTLDKNKLTEQKEICKVYYSDTTEFTFNPKYGYATIDQIPKHVQDAVVAIEDRRFYSHNGIDYRSILRAIKNNAISGKLKEGASTITQQLAKNTYLTGEKTLDRKLKEIKLAKLLEQEYTKDEILEKYLNTVYFGENSYGIVSASANYFGKRVEDLTVEEGALLAALLKAPTYYNPYKNPSKAKLRRNVVLDQMAQQKMLSYECVKNLKNCDISLNFESNYDTYNAVYEEIISQAVSLLNARNVSDLKGYKIYTSIDPQLNGQLPTVKDFSLDNDFSIIVTDNKTANIIAYLSTVGEIKRCPASCAKPWLIYAPAIEENMISQATKIVDEPTNFGGYSPENPGNKYYGLISVKDALSKSLNIPAVKTCNMLGLDKIKQYANKMDIHYDNDDLSLALGNLSGGMTLKQLSDAYSIFYNKGFLTKSSMILKIENNNNKTVYSSTSESKKIISDSTAYIITDILREGAKTGTASKLSSLPYFVCAKTGTNGNSYGNVDAYCVAYTQDHTVAVWIGNKSGSTMQNTINGGNYPTSIVKEIFNTLYNNYKPEDISPPESVVSVSIDKSAYEKDAKIYTNSKSEKDGLSFWFKRGYEPTKTIEKKQIQIVIKNFKITCNKREIEIICERDKGVEYLLFDNTGKQLFDSLKNDKFTYIAPYDGEFNFFAQPYILDGKNRKMGEKIKLPSVIVEGSKDILSSEWWVD